MAYLDYWGLTKPPFDNVPDPSMYFDQHSSVENAVAEVMFAIEEGNECLAVLVGDVGLGKTMALRVILDSLDESKYNIAFVTNPDLTFPQLLREIIGQLTGQQCEIKKKEQLLDKLNQLLFETQDKGKKVLIFIDEANVIRPANLESLRLLTNLQDDTQNLMTIIMAGQLELAHRLEHPRRANLFQRIGVYCHLEKIESRDRVKEYVEHRLKVGGSKDKLFSDGAIEQIWEYSNHGVPRLVNKICKLALKAGETNEFKKIDTDTVVQIGQRFQRLSLTPETKRKERKRAPDAFLEERAPQVEEIKEAQIVEAEEVAPPPSLPTAAPVSDPAEILRTKYDIQPAVVAGAAKFSEEYRLKLAGNLAAQAIKKRPGLLAESGERDPFKAWAKIRDEIKGQLDRAGQGT